MKSTVQTVVCGQQVVTMDANQPIIEDGAVAIDDGYIIGLGTSTDIFNKYTIDHVVSGEGKVVLPGLINGHTHAAMTLLRGYADDLTLMDWLNSHINPAEAALVDPSFVEIGTKLACWEMLLGGTTTFVDMYFYHEVAAKVVDSVGIRALISATMVDQPRNDVSGMEEQWDQALKFVKQWSNKSANVVPILGGHAIYTLSTAQLQKLRSIAMNLNVPVNIHLSESQFELEFAKDNFDGSPIEYLNEINYFDPHVIAAHVVWPQEKDFEILKQNGVGVIHNPSSNTKISSGVAPIAKFLEEEITVGLGTDGAATNNDLDMWEEMRLAAFVQKVHCEDATVLPARTVLEMATSQGAKAIGMQDHIGQLKEGMRADLIQVDVNQPHMLPMYDVESHLVYTTQASDVTNVFVNGKQLVKDRVSTTIDVPQLRQNIEQLARTIRHFREGRS